MKSLLGYCRKIAVGAKEFDGSIVLGGGRLSKARADDKIFQLKIWNEINS